MVGDLFGAGFRFFAPEIALAEAETHLPARSSIVDASVDPVDHEFYRIFESDARERLRGRGEG